MARFCGGGWYLDTPPFWGPRVAGRMHSLMCMWGIDTVYPLPWGNKGEKWVVGWVC